MQSLNIFWVWTITTSGWSAFLFCNKSNTFCLDLITLKVFDWLYFLWLIDISFILFNSCLQEIAPLQHSAKVSLLGQYEIDGEKQQIDDPYMASIFFLSLFPMPLVQRRGVGYINQFTYSSVYSQKAQCICNLHHFHL